MRTEYPVTVCESGPHAALRISRPVRGDRLGLDIACGMRELEALIQESGLTARGPATTTAGEHIPHTGAEMVQFDVPLELAPRLGPRTAAEVVVVPGTLVARTVHRGGYHGLGAAYRALWEWLRDSGFHPVGPPVQAYLVGPDEVVDPTQLLTEIRLPVERVRALRVLAPGPHDRVVAATETALRRQGFRILARTELDGLRAPGSERRTLLTACHSRLADRTSDTGPKAPSPVLPCLLVLRESPSGGTEVAAADPGDSIADVVDADLTAYAEYAHHLLAAALAEVSAEYRTAAGVDADRPFPSPAPS
ncbi:GyrI-like domain-containing protein [Nocardia stercoris]|uniref:GyrI-like domain-containing protein n=1 Tax=Nocardia stercoris TaxID=2483361 RepID=UPI0011C41098|nr:GyrI-like domain-containing protein [Nocardia stercoris]